DSEEPARALVWLDPLLGRPPHPDGQQRIGTRQSWPRIRPQELLRLGLSVGRPAGGNAFFALCNHRSLWAEPASVAPLVSGKLRRGRRKGAREHPTIPPLELL